MDNLFLFFLRLSFLVPIIAGGVLAIKGNTRPGFVLNVIVVQSLAFGILNVFHNELIGWLGTDRYFTLYTALEFTSFALIIQATSSARSPSKLLLVCSVIFFANLILHALSATNKRGDSLNIGIETILVLINIIHFFYLRFKQVDEQYLYQNPFFWFMTGMLIYLGFTFFFNILVYHVDNEVIKNYYHFSYIGDILKNCLFAVGLTLLPRAGNTVDRTHSFNAPKLDLI